ncbi:amidohydrolase family protein [Acetobacter sp. LMG 1636]|uniref:Amidohydrolase family protein n=2 Tax=Acetobacter fallax TaxID=1737473 RepID=A0ABX0KKK7_9PROT|nr:amidohydrolase family protein [Acetobacter fallax]NHO34412.1 amidohydrolase family protein [Acetobacter fallax]NHO37976.1 amidohydrolase family protein [Acetobacter fallax]
MLDALSPGEVVLSKAALLIDQTGMIVERAESGTSQFDQLLRHHDTTWHDERSILMPGLVDLHIHAPQWPQLGTALDRPLEQWLKNYTFPLEERYNDIAFARGVYEELVPALLAQGTTTALYFATIHEKSSLELARSCLKYGQRGFVGLVAMDDSILCPETYRYSEPEAAISATRRFIDAVRQLPGNEGGLVQPVITPRFIPACSETLLRGLGDLACETDVRVQTHASESDWEHDYVKDRFRCTDVEALEAFGLLRRHTVLAHAGFTSADDRKRIRKHHAAIAHCPISNAFFAGAILPIRHLLDEGTACGLGTDISGGYSPSILENARQAVVAARMLTSGVNPDLLQQKRGSQGMAIDFTEAFWLATRGGAEALGVPVGQLRPGMMFDALKLDPRVSMLFPSEEDNAEETVQKIICHAGIHSIACVWVNGRIVSGRYN